MFFAYLENEFPGVTDCHSQIPVIVGAKDCILQFSSVGDHGESGTEDIRISRMETGRRSSEYDMTCHSDRLYIYFTFCP